MKREKPGFTLVEILLYLGLLAVFLLILTQTLVATLDVLTEAEVTSAVEQDGRYILARLSYDLGRAQEILIPESLGAQTNSLQLLLSDVSYTYNLDGTNLVLANNLVRANLNSEDTRASGLVFQRLGNPDGKHTINLSFTLTSASQRPAGPETKTFQITIGTR